MVPLVSPSLPLCLVSAIIDREQNSTQKLAANTQHLQIQIASRASEPAAYIDRGF